MSCKNVSTHSTKILLVTFSLFYASTGPDLQTVALCYRPVHSFVLLFYVFCLLPNLLTWCFENKNKQAVRLGRRHNMPPPHLDHWPFDLEVGVGVACDLGYPCAKFRPPRPFGFRVRADVRDIRQTDGRTDDRRWWPPNAPPPLRGRGHNKLILMPVGTSGPRGRGMKRLEVRVQGCVTLKTDLATWQKHHSPPLA